MIQILLIDKNLGIPLFVADWSLRISISISIFTVMFTCRQMGSGVPYSIEDAKSEYYFMVQLLIVFSLLTDSD